MPDKYQNNDVKKGRHPVIAIASHRIYYKTWRMPRFWCLLCRIRMTG